MPPPPSTAPLLPIYNGGVRVAADVLLDSAKTRDGREYKVPVFKFGNKSVSLRKGVSENKAYVWLTQPTMPRVYVGDLQDDKLTIQFVGNNKHGFGYPFTDIKGDSDSVETDVEKKIFTYKKPYLTSEGKRAVFTYTMKSLDDSRVELLWDSGSDERIELWVPMGDKRDWKVTFGSEVFKHHSKEELKKQKNYEIKKTVSGSMNFDCGTPTKSFKLLFDDESATGELTEQYLDTQWGDRFAMIYRNKSLGKSGSKNKGRIVIDLGECIVNKGESDFVGNLDFWEIDATDVPLSPVCNVMRNPSFEQGLRYWRFRDDFGDSAKKNFAFEISDDAFDGKKSLLLRDGNALSFPMSLKNKETYTLSFYAKAAGKNTNLLFGIKNAGSGGTIPGLYGHRGLGDFDNKDAKFKVTDQWKRYSRTFTADNYGLRLVLSGKDILIDAIQLEAASAPSDFVSVPLEGNFTTSAADNSLSFGEPINAMFEVFGKSGAEGKIKISIKNIFYENVFEKNIDVKIGADGVAKIPLDLNPEKVGEGLFVVRADFDSDAKKYREYYRFSIMKKLSNTHATKNIFGTLQGYDRLPDQDYAGRRFMEWGFGSTTWFSPLRGKDVQKSLEKKKQVMDIMRKYRFTNTVSTSNFAQYNFDPTKDTFGDNFDPKWGDFKKWKTVSAELEKAIEQEGYLYAKNFPKDMTEALALGNEEEHNYDGHYDEYAKAQTAFMRGVKRADKGFRVLPTHGTCQYKKNYLYGRKGIDSYIESAKKLGSMYDGIGIHLYWSFDFNQDPDDRFDESIAYLLSRMKHYGFADSAPIYISECCNLCDVSVPFWNSHWNDTYSAGRLSYDFNNQELFQAFVYARIYLSSLKYYPRLRSVNVWTYVPFADAYLTPIALCKAVNTLGNLYGDVSFVGDIRLDETVMGYVFNLKNGGAIAAVWAYDEEIVRSKKASPTMSVRFGQEVEFFDLAGNRREVKPDKNGVFEFTVGAAPLSIKAENVDRLYRALRNARVKPFKN